MGGNALKSPTRRLEASKYHPLAEKIASELSELIGSRVEALRAFHTKEDFGDMDLLVDKQAVFSLSKNPEDPWEGVLEWAKSHGAQEFVRAGSSLCFGVPLGDGHVFPVELQATPLEDFQTARDYYAYNDLGNLIGRVAHKMGMKFGHLGLLYPLRDGHHLIAEIVVTRDTRKAFEFMGYDYERWEKGFDTLEDIFHYAASTPYFNPEAFSMENLNHRNRTRNRKRKTFMNFLAWLEDGGFKGTPYVFPEDKSQWLPYIRQAFPEFGKQMDDLIDRYERGKAFRNHFNGNILSQWTGLEGKELGQAMACVRKTLGEGEVLAQVYADLGPQAFREKVMEVVASDPKSAPRPRP